MGKSGLSHGDEGAELGNLESIPDPGWTVPATVQAALERAVSVRLATELLARAGAPRIHAENSFGFVCLGCMMILHRWCVCDAFSSAELEETLRMAPKLGVAPVRREQIIQATIRCLARDGSSGLRMKSVAREAGVSQGILHYYFGNKRALLIAALDTVMADLNRRLARLLEGTRDARARLRAVIEGCLGLADENREFWIVFVEFWGEMMHDEELLRFNAALYRQLRRTLGALVAQGIRAGLFRRVDPEEAGAVILALVDGVSLQRTFDPNAFPLERATRFCNKAITRYLAKR